MDHKDVQLIEKVTVFQGYFRVDRYRLRHRLFQGGWSAVIQREVFERGHAVAVLPFDAVANKVVLIDQFRAGAYAHGGQPWQIEIIAGIIGEGEDEQQVVCREAIEEAGCIFTREPVRICQYYMSPGATSEHMSVYVGATDSSALGGVYGLSEENEDIRVLVVDLDDALQMLEEGRISNSPTIIALQWLALHRKELTAAESPD